jgi:YidC/Oxa1 family membrane protein insertase
MEGSTGVTVEYREPSGEGYRLHLSSSTATIDHFSLTGPKYDAMNGFLGDPNMPMGARGAGLVSFYRQVHPGELVSGSWKLSTNPVSDKELKVELSRELGELYSGPGGEIKNPLAGLRVKKTFIFGIRNLAVGMELAITNGETGAMDLSNPDNGLGFAVGIGAGLGDSFQDDQMVTFDGSSLATHSPVGFTATGEETRFKAERKLNWTGLRDRYFTALVVPENPSQEAFIRGYQVKDSSAKGILCGVAEKGFTMEPGETRKFSYNLYLGPKDRTRLKRQGIYEVYEPGFWGLKLAVIEILNFFFTWTGSWGWSIIILTVALKLALYPLTFKQTKSMHETQKIQPLVKALQEKHKDNPQKLNQEIMELYKKHDVNPFGGCLPLLVQLPILYALFTALQESIELKGESFLWMKDLSLPDTSLVIPGLPWASIPLLPITIALSMYLQQKQMTADPNQAKMMAFMPILMFFICQALPSGVLVYWLISNVLSMYQQERIKSALDSPANEKKSSGKAARA